MRRIANHHNFEQKTDDYRSTIGLGASGSTRVVYKWILFGAAEVLFLDVFWPKYGRLQQ
jgi:hypothetical protein